MEKQKISSKSEIEEYLRKHKVEEILSSITEGICLCQPENVYSFIFDFCKKRSETSENLDPITEPDFPSINDRAGYRPKDYTF